MTHIFCIKSSTKPDLDFDGLTAKLKIMGHKVYVTNDWVSALNYNSVEKADAIWLQWACIKNNYNRFHNEIFKHYSNLPLILLHDKGKIPDIICKKNSLLFSVLDKSSIMENFEPVLEKLEIYNKFILELPHKGNFKLRPEGFGPFIGNSKEMLNLYKILYKVSVTNFSVLITGESGTGKELVASSIHKLGKRQKHKFIAINCAAIPDNLLESELFGYEKGAFTDAKQAKPGKFELGDKGTIFLDEIGDMPLLLQTKLLRVIEDGTFERLGGKDTIKVDIRLLAATNQNLKELIEEKKFRSELYYRLNVIPITLPPLSSRKDDFIILVLHLLGSILEKNPDTPLDINWKLIYDLKNQNIPGNVRELENLLIRLVFESNFPEIQENVISDQGNNTGNNRPGLDTNDEVLPLEEVEKKAIEHALTKNNGNMSSTAAALKISRATLYRKLKTYGLEN